MVALSQSSCAVCSLRWKNFDLRSRQSPFALRFYRAAHFMTVKDHLATFEKVGFINPREICPAADLSLMAAEKPI
jgi:hypothetical protein